MLLYTSQKTFFKQWDAPYLDYKDRILALNDRANVLKLECLHEGCSARLFCLSFHSRSTFEQPDKWLKWLFINYSCGYDHGGMVERVRLAEENFSSHALPSADQAERVHEVLDLIEQTLV